MTDDPGTDDGDDILFFYGIFSHGLHFNHQDKRANNPKVLQLNLI